MKAKEIIAGLQSNDQKKIDKAIAALKANGDKSVLRPMVEFLMNSTNEKQTKEIIETFSSLKDSSVVEEMMEIIKDEQYIGQRQVILSTMWNAQIDYSYYLADFVSIALEGTLLEALDCLTIMENMAGPFQERHLLEAQWHMKEFMEDEAPKDTQKMQIISEIALFIKDADEAIEG